LNKKEKIIFCTKLFNNIEKSKQYKKIDLNNFIQSIKTIKKQQETKEIEIWGITTTKKNPYNKIIKVNDHINFTGNNPLIGNQKRIETAFPDMSKVYKKNKEGVVTISRGKYFLKDNEYDYQTQYFCYFGIIARALGIKKISGYLINKEINILKKHIVAKN
tara:strand:- start:958 stop:1440 length:483 start_codon:yes stop_codon:yes gene_type:complete